MLRGKLLRFKRAVLVIVTCLGVLLLQNAANRQSRWSLENNNTKPFIYLTQTGQCLPSNLTSSAQIGDSSTCNCDVIVQSYHQECKEHRPPHFSYLFAPQSSWATGRNMLFNAARERTAKYHYYIVLDDDICLKYNNFTPSEMKQLQPFRVFENWLLDYEPAVGVLDYWHHGVEYLLERRQQLCGISERSLVMPTVIFDALFNAFHHKALEHFLPYSTRYDDLTLLAANARVLTTVELKFRGQALLFAPISVTNAKHRQVQENKIPVMRELWVDFIEENQRQAPVIYQNHALFKSHKKHLKRHLENTLTYCVGVKRHQPLLPYAHFARTTV